MKIYIHTVLLFLLISCKTENKSDNYKMTRISGAIFGTTYSVIYDSEIDYEFQLDSIYYVLNKSLSTYQANSDISKINRNEDVEIDEHFIKVLEASNLVYEQTDGAFDPTIGSVVNAWDFGPEGKLIGIDSIKIDSLMTSVGFDKVQFAKNRIQKPLGAFLDFNAIAKGYAVDVIAEFFDLKNIDNYLIEIGGEIHVKGKNIEKNSSWRAGIEHPHFDENRSVMKTILLNDESMATSGTYRKFKVDEDGQRYSHIIDTSTGYPSKTNILSVSVLTKSCMMADAYATAFKSMGLEKVKTFLDANSEIKAYLIYENTEGELETLSLNNFPD